MTTMMGDFAYADFTLGMVDEVVVVDENTVKSY